MFVPWSSSYLHSQAVVPLDHFVAVLGAIADGAVYFEHAGVSGAEQRCHAGAHHCSERSPVHSLTKMILLSHNARVLLLSKILISQNVILKEERSAGHVLFLPVYCFALI